MNNKRSESQIKKELLPCGISYMEQGITVFPQIVCPYKIQAECATLLSINGKCM